MSIFRDRSASRTPAASRTRATSRTRAAARTAPQALLADAALVVVFASIGRASHDEGLTAGGLAQTSWPFLSGLAAGWLATRAWRLPAAPVRTGLGVWTATVVIGMLLRALTGQGTAPAFIVVAAVSLLVLLVGWRGIATLVSRR